MRKKEKDEVALLSIDRNPLILLLNITISAILLYLSYDFIVNLKPLGFVLIIPATFLSFQTIWLILTPFAMIFDDKLEVKRSLFSNKMLFFVDVKKIGVIKKQQLWISYIDDEVDKIQLFGIKKSQLEILKEEFQKHVTLALNKRL